MHKVGLIQVVQKQYIKLEDIFVKSFANASSAETFNNGWMMA